MPDPIALALSQQLAAWRGNIPSSIRPTARVAGVMEEIFGRKTPPRSTWNTQAGAGLSTRRTVEPALANGVQQVLADLLTTEAADAALGFGVDPNELVLQTTLPAVATRLAALVTNEMERNTMRGAMEAIRIARADGVSAATTLYTLLGTPPSQVQGAYDAFTMQDSVLTTLADTLRHDAAQWGKFIGTAAGARATGQTLTKTWLTTMDGRERPSHHALNDSTIAFAATWTDDGVERTVPGGWNCRCDVRYTPGPDRVAKGALMLDAQQVIAIDTLMTGLIEKAETDWDAVLKANPNRDDASGRYTTGAGGGPDLTDTTASRPVGRNSWMSTSPREKFALALADVHAKAATHRQLAADHLYRPGPGHAAAGKAHGEAARALTYAADHLRNAMQGQGAFSGQTFREHMQAGRKAGALGRAMSDLAKLAHVLYDIGKFNQHHDTSGKFAGPDASSLGSQHGEGPAGDGGARGAGDPLRAERAAGRGSDRGGRGGDAGPDARAGDRGGKSVRVLGDTVGVRASFTPSAALRATLTAAGGNAPTFHELDATDPHAATAFVSAISALKSASPYGAAVHVYEPSDYAAMRLFVTDGGTSGFALKPDGDMVSLFSRGGDGHAALELGIVHGATKLDCFDTVLPHLYAKHGFVETARLPWNDEHAPADWDKTTFKAFNGGEPDVVFMAYAPESASGPKKTAPYAADYDAAVASQTRVHKSAQIGNPYHDDASGRFTSGPGGAGAVADAPRSRTLQPTTPSAALVRLQQLDRETHAVRVGAERAAAASREAMLTGKITRAERERLLDVADEADVAARRANAEYEALRAAEGMAEFYPVDKSSLGNPYHDAAGLFTHGPGGGSAVDARTPSAVHAPALASSQPPTLILPPLTDAQLAHAATLPALTKYDTPEIKLLREKAKSQTQTADLPGREGLRQHVLDELYGTGAAKKDRVAHLIMGGPGTGKSTAIGDQLMKEAGAILVDSDEAKKLLPEFDGGKGAGVVHAESSLIATSLLQRAALAGDNIVNPTVGATFDKIDSKITDLKAMGYTVHLHLVNLPEDEAVTRVMARMKSAQRFVDTDYVVNTVDSKPPIVFDQLRDDPRLASADAYDNNVPFGQPPRHTFSRERAAVHKESPGRRAGAGSGRDAGRRAQGGPSPVRGSVSGTAALAKAVTPTSVGAHSRIERGLATRAIGRKAQIHKSGSGCTSCTFYTGAHACFAYKQIPHAYLNGTLEHTVRHPGTGGFTYRPVHPDDVVTKALDAGIGPHLAAWFGDLVAGRVGKSTLLPTEQIVVGHFYPNARADGTLTVDRQGDVITMTDLKKTIDGFMAGPRILGVDHQRIGPKASSVPVQVGEVLESLLLTTRLRKSLGLPSTMDLGWVGAAHLTHGPTWQSVLRGERLAFSVGGRAERIAIAAGPE